MKNAIFFSSVRPSPVRNVLKNKIILNYSLYTLEKHLSDNRNYDVFFFTDDPELMDRLKSRYLWLNVIYFNNQDYIKHGLEPFWMTQLQAHKYFNFLYFADKHYEQVLLLDTDTYFSGDPSIVFDFYEKNKEYCLAILYPCPEVDFAGDHHEWYLNQLEKYNGHKLGNNITHGYPGGMNCGQVLLKKHHIQTIQKRFIAEYVDEVKHQNDIIYELENRGIFDSTLSIAVHDYIDGLRWAIDEPALKLVLENHGIYVEQFNHRHVEYHLTAPRPDPAIITHYGVLAQNTKLVIPQDFVDKYIKELSCGY